MPLSEEDFWDLWSFVIIFEDVGNWWELQGCLVYKMHLASVILSLSTQTWSECHFINNLNEICSDARIWQRCARTRCDFRRKGSISKLWGQIFSIEWNRQKTSHAPFWRRFLGFVIICDHFWRCWELMGIARVFGLYNAFGIRNSVFVDANMVRMSFYKQLEWNLLGRQDLAKVCQN